MVMKLRGKTAVVTGGEGGKFIYASGGDLCIYGQPLEPLSFIRKGGKWSIDDNDKTFPDPKIPIETKKKDIQIIPF